jgi:hypothetical protein
MRYQCNKDSETWKKIEKSFQETMPGHKIADIHIIQNLPLWEIYQVEREHLKRKLKKEPMTLLLWHGTRQTDPALIY